MLKELFFGIWFFLPAGAANMAPIFAAHVPQLKHLDIPIDFGKSLRGKRVLGDHKTWRGLAAGIVLGTLVLYFQQLLTAHVGWLHEWTSYVAYAHLPALVLGPLFALGALGGDAIESFFKRQAGIQPGRSWFPFDQTDYIIGAAIASAPFVTFSPLQYLGLVVLWLIIHLAASAAGYLAGLKERPI